MASSNPTVTKAEDYEIMDKIGHGSFGIIRRVRRKADGLILCRKEINYLKMSQKEREQLHAEFQCLSHLRHPNIVAYYHRDHLKETQELHLYMEYCGNGDLGRVIKDLASKGQRASEQFVWSIFGQLSSALYRCHYGIDPPSPSDGTSNPEKAPAGTLCIMHRDLKPENVFLGENNSVKLGDFGLSKMIKSQDFASTYVGTPYYMSPEICAAERYTLKSDIWSLGCIIYELCMRSPPFDARSHYQLVQKIKDGQYPALPNIYSSELRDAIDACLRKSPDARPSTHDLLHLPQIRLTRREMELAELKRKLRAKQDALAQKEKELNHFAGAIETEKKLIRQEIDSQLRREWEARAQLEISRHINLEVENLQKQFETEVRARVEAELKRRESLSGPQRTATPEPEAKKSPISSVQDQLAVTAISAPVAESLPSEATAGLTKRNMSTPLKRAHTMYPGLNPETPGDIEMVSPSPMAISSLSLSPRRNGTTKPPTNNVNIFQHNKAAAGSGNGLAWEVPRDAVNIESDDEEPPASPTPAVRSNRNPFGKNRPVLLAQKSAPNRNLSIPTLASKNSNSELPSVSPSRRLSKIPSVTSLHNAKLSSGSSSSGSSSDTNNIHGSPTRGKKLVRHQHHHSSGDEERLGKVLAKNNIKGRTLVELQQARAGGRPLSAVLPSSAVLAAPSSSTGENVSPKRAFRDRLTAAEGNSRRSSDPTVWDPEVDEMPSPFLQKTRQVRA
ncbi:G2-specific serine/threonine protein kinase [Ceratocystis pirilliformis]|uniref:non-specific serine/threonine protein kinase n=1 Tax=Ceratocystis pirilliformis TaxID=259994 RepID=A0ABR3YPH7_9PEZI